MSVEFVEWREGMEQDMFINCYWAKVSYGEKGRKSFLTSMHCAKTGCEQAEIEAVKEQIEIGLALEGSLYYKILAGEKCHRIEVEKNGLWNGFFKDSIKCYAGKNLFKEAL